MDFPAKISNERTLGDGIDNSLLHLNETLSDKKCANLNINYKNTPITFKPIEPKCQIFSLKPVFVPKERKQPKCLIRKPKEPKFIPYEPYKGAVEPILPQKIEVKQKSSKNNVEIQDLVVQMSEMRMAELNKVSQEMINKEEVVSMKEFEKLKVAYDNDVKNLRESNAHLENQIKFQAQVNSELKTLLVAAVGEDLESRVQHLTEDKLQLARALLNSANHLTSHQEKTEWLSGQCEVWRSKFLASSLMVEELARWKSALSSRLTDLQETVKRLLDERFKVQKKAQRTCCILQEVTQQLDSKVEKYEVPKSSNILDLSDLSYKMSQEISNLVNIDKEKYDSLYEKYSKLSQHTEAERNAMRLLQNPVTVSNNQDVVCKALMGSAMLLSGEQMYLKYPSTQATCCAHCTGEVLNI